MYRYTVRCQFTSNDSQLVDRWVDWLRQGHIADVMAGGASGAEVVRMRAEQPTFEIRYQFPTRQAFDRYLAKHAPRLRDEGLAKFPLDLGLEYERTDGEVIFRMPADTGSAQVS